MEKELTLKEKYILLAYHPERGRPLAFSSYHSYGLSGAVLLELADQDKIKIEGKKAILKNNKKTGDYALDLAIEKISSAKSRKKTQTWISRLANSGSYRKIRNNVLEGLVRKQILRKEEGSALWIIKYQKYPLRDTGLRKSLVREIRDVVLKNHLGAKDIYLLIGLIGATKLTSSVFERGERKKARKRIREVMKSNDVAKALEGTVAAVQTAIIASIAASAAATAAATSN